MHRLFHSWFIGGSCLVLAGCLTGGSSAVEPQPDYSLAFDRPLSSYRTLNHAKKLNFEIGVFGGERAFRVAHTNAVPLPRGQYDDTAWSVASDRFPVRGGRRYAIKVRARGNCNMVVNLKATKVCWFGADGKELVVGDALGKDVAFTSPFGFRCEDMRWIETVVRGAVPAEASFAQIVLGADTPNVNPGQEIALAYVNYYESEPGAEPVFTGDFEGPKVVDYAPDRACADFGRAITFRLVDASGVDASTLRCTLDGVDVTADVRKGWFSDVYRYEPPADWQEGTLHEFTIACSDVRGNAMKPESHFSYFTRRPVRHPKYAIRDDGMTLRDGVPFFPMGVSSFRACKYNGNDVAAAMAELKDVGFNTYSTYIYGWKPGDEKQYAALVRESVRLDVPAMFEPAPRSIWKQFHGGDMRKREAVLVDQVVKGRELACTFGWTIGDDTADNRTPEELARDYRIIRAIDPDALTISADYLGYDGREQPYMAYADVFDAELYPFRKGRSEDPGELPRAANDVKISFEQQAANPPLGNCAVWATGQSFDGWGFNRYPTYEELRAQAYLYVAMRCRGLKWYTYCNGGQNLGAKVVPSRWEELVRLTRELKSYERDLVARDAARQPTVEIVEGPKADAAGNPPVKALLKETGLLIAAHSGNDPVVARVTMPDGTSFIHRFPRNGVLVERK